MLYCKRQTPPNIAVAVVERALLLLPAAVSFQPFPSEMFGDNAKCFKLSRPVSLRTPAFFVSETAVSNRAGQSLEMRRGEICSRPSDRRRSATLMQGSRAKQARWALTSAMIAATVALRDRGPFKIGWVGFCRLRPAGFAAGRRRSANGGTSEANRGKGLDGAGAAGPVQEKDGEGRYR